MRRLRVPAMIFAVLLMAFTNAAAQDAAPLRIGGTLPGDIAWSPDGSRLLVAASDKTRLYAAGEWESPVREFGGALRASFVDNRVMELDGERFDATTGAPVEILIETPPQAIRFYDFQSSPSERYSYKVEQSNSQYTLFVQDHHLATDVSLDISDDANVEQIIFSPRETHLALIYRDSSDTRKRLQLWELGRNVRLFEARAHRGSTFKDVHFSLGGRSLIAIETVDGYYGTYDLYSREYLNVWNTTTGALVFGKLASQNDPIIYGPIGQWFAFAPDWYGDSSNVWIWTGLRLIKTRIGYSYQTAFSSDGTIIASLTEERSGQANKAMIILLRLDLARHSYTRLGAIPLAQHSASQASFSLNDDGSMIIVAEPRSKRTLWRTSDLTQITELDTKQSLDDVLYSPDGSLFAIGHTTFWDAQTGEKRYEADAPVKIAPDWSHIARWDGSDVLVTNTHDWTEVRPTQIDTSFGLFTALDPLNRWALFKREGEIAAVSLDYGTLLFSVPTETGAPLINTTANGALMSVTPPYTGSAVPPSTFWDVSASDPHQIGSHTLYGALSLNADGSAYALFDSGYYRGMGVISWYSPATGTLIYEWEDSLRLVNDIASHPFRSLLAVEGTIFGAKEHVMIVLDVAQTLASKTPVALFYLSGDYSAPRFSPAGGYLTLRCGLTCLGLVDLNDVPEAGIMLEPPIRYFQTTSAIAFDAPETMVLTKNTDTPTAELWLPGVEESIVVPATGTAIALSGDSTRAATVVAEGIAVWDVARLEAGETAPLAVYPLPELAVTELRFDADNRLIAVDAAGVTVYEGT